MFDVRLRASHFSSRRTAGGPEHHFATLGSSHSKGDVALVVGSTGQRRSSSKVDQPVARKRANVGYPRPPPFAGGSRLAATSLLASVNFFRS